MRKANAPEIGRLIKSGLANLVFFMLGFIMIIGGPAGSAGLPPVPETPQKAVTDVYHGVEIVDNYRWLEDFSDPVVQAWSNAQNSRTRTALDRIPERENIFTYLEMLHAETSAEYYYFQYRNGLLFAYKWQPPAEQPYLIVLESLSDPISERIILDPNKLNPVGTTSMDFYVPSLDGKLAAVSLSEEGSEIGTVHVYDVTTGGNLPDTIPRVNGPTAGGGLAWIADGSGFYYTRYPREGERPKEDLHFFQQVYFHNLGTPTSEDTYAIGKEFPRIAEIDLATSKDGRYILAAVANGDGGEYNHYLLGPSGVWKEITKFSDLISRVKFGPDSALYMLSRKNAPFGKILRLPPATPELDKAEIVVDESEVVIRGFVPAANYLYVTDLIGGPNQIRVFDLAGNQQGTIPVKPVSSVWGMLAIEEGKILFNNESYIEPPAWYIYDPATGKTVQTALAVTSPADFGDVEVVREFAVSKDGTGIPINIIRRRGVQPDGDSPTILKGYGGFGISLTPGFDPGRRLWLDQGGIYVIANLRGGGEFGEEWHRAGYLTNKQNVFDDFISCAEYLISTGYTNPNKLAIEGGSNGGLLMGAALTQRPELFRAVVAHVGVLDMVNYVQDPNGVFNITEYGSVDDPEQFKAIYAYSPYHHVVDGVAYPDVLFLTGRHDGRVKPYHSRKMTARLQAAVGSQADILLRTSSSTGHGGGTAFSEKIAKTADVYAFICRKLGIDYIPYVPDVE